MEALGYVVTGNFRARQGKYVMGRHSRPDEVDPADRCDEGTTSGELDPAPDDEDQRDART